MLRKMDRFRPEEIDGRENSRSCSIALGCCGVSLFHATMFAAASVWAPGVAADPVPVVEQGLPPTVIPTYRERGAPTFSYPTGGTSTGNGGSGGGGGGGSGAGVNYNACPGCNPLQTMMAQSWGSAAADAARAIGVSPEALAATCVLESGCRSINGVGTVSGAFQMTNATYLQEIRKVAAQNPGLDIDTSLAGKMNAANQAYASAQYLYDGATYLQNNGIANPTIMDVRAYYQFGPSYSAQLAGANNSDNLENIVQLSPAAMAANGITSATTVGDWRQAIANKLGPTAMNAVAN